MPSRWTNIEQERLIESWKASFYDHQKRKDLDGFWAKAYLAWFSNWPVGEPTEGDIANAKAELRVCPDTPAKEIETLALRRAQENLKKAARTRLYDTCWNRFRTKNTVPRVEQIQLEAPKKKNALSLPHAFAKMFSDSINDAVEKEWKNQPNETVYKDEHGKIRLAPRRINVFNRIARDMYQKATPEVQFQVQQFRERYNANLEKEFQDKNNNEGQGEDLDPDAAMWRKARKIHAIPDTLRRMSDAIARETGFCAIVAVCGPNPERGGELASYMYSTAHNVNGEKRTFLDHFPRYELLMKGHLNNYGKAIFPAENRLKCALPGTVSTCKTNGNELDGATALNEEAHAAIEGTEVMARLLPDEPNPYSNYANYMMGPVDEYINADACGLPSLDDPDYLLQPSTTSKRKNPSANLQNTEPTSTFQPAAKRAKNIKMNESAPLASRPENGANFPPSAPLPKMDDHPIFAEPHHSISAEQAAPSSTVFAISLDGNSGAPIHPYYSAGYALGDIPTQNVGDGRDSIYNDAGVAGGHGMLTPTVMQNHYTSFDNSRQNFISHPPTSSTVNHLTSLGSGYSVVGSLTPDTATTDHGTTDHRTSAFNGAYQAPNLSAAPTDDSCNHNIEPAAIVGTVLQDLPPAPASFDEGHQTREYRRGRSAGPPLRAPSPATTDKPIPVTGITNAGAVGSDGGSDDTHLNSTGQYVSKGPGGKVIIGIEGISSDVPNWVLVARKTFITVSDNDEWVSLVAAWMDFEARLGFPSDNDYNLLSLSNAPSPVLSFSKTGSFTKVPHVSKPPLYASQFRKWWNSLRPSPPPPKKGKGKAKKAGSVVMDWTPLRKGGPRGYVTLVYALCGWLKAIKSESDGVVWRELFGEVKSALESMAD